MTDYDKVLNAIRPGTDWVLRGNTYDGLIWKSDSPKPSKKTLDDAWPQVKHDLEVAAIREQRRARYASDTDPMFYRVQRGEDGITLDDWKAAVDAIRADLPYPPAPGGDA